MIKIVLAVFLCLAIEQVFSVSECADGTHAGDGYGGAVDVICNDDGTTITGTAPILLNRRYFTKVVDLKRGMRDIIITSKDKRYDIDTVLIVDDACTSSSGNTELKFTNCPTNNGVLTTNTQYGGSALTYNKVCAGFSAGYPGSPGYSRYGVTFSNLGSYRSGTVTVGSDSNEIKFSGDCVNIWSPCGEDTSTYKIQERVYIPGELKFDLTLYIFAYSTSGCSGDTAGGCTEGQVEYSYINQCESSTSVSCTPCPTTWVLSSTMQASKCGTGGCSGNEANCQGRIICDGSETVKCGCNAPNVADYEGVSSVTCGSTEPAADCAPTAVACNDGYVVNTDSVGPYCEDWGAWAGTGDNMCVPATCANNDAITNSVSTTSCAGRAVGETCTFECEVGYESSDAVATCTAIPGGAEWDDYSACAQMSCSLPPTSAEIANVDTTNANNCIGSGSVAHGDTCTDFTCSSGFQKGNDATCSMGTYQGGTCVDANCDSLPSDIARFDSLTPSVTAPYDSGTSYSFSCTYDNTNDRYYEPSGEVACYRGEWSSPTCDPARCTTQPNITGISPTSCTNVAHGAQCSFTCVNDELDNTRTAVGITTCEYGVYQNEDDASCVVDEACGIPSVQHGFYVDSSWTSSSNGSTLDASKISCMSGYTRTATTDFECICSTEGGNSSPCQELSDACVPIPCVAIVELTPSHYTNATANCPSSNAIHEPECEFTCQVGYHVVGNAQRETEVNISCDINGEWEEYPQCEAFTCPLQTSESQPLNGTTASGNCLVGSGAPQSPATCSFTCETGFEIQGSDTITCQPDGTWPAFPICVASECTPLSVGNSSAESTPATGVTRDEVNIICDEGFTGSGTVQCQRDGSFTSLECVPEACEPFRVPFSRDYINADVTGTTFDVVNIQCDDDWATDVSYDTTCYPNGSFYPQIECTPINQCVRRKQNYNCNSDESCNQILSSEWDPQDVGNDCQSSPSLGEEFLCGAYVMNDNGKMVLDYCVIHGNSAGADERTDCVVSTDGTVGCVHEDDSSTEGNDDGDDDFTSTTEENDGSDGDDFTSTTEDNDNEGDDGSSTTEDNDNEGDDGSSTTEESDGGNGGEDEDSTTEGDDNDVGSASTSGAAAGGLLLPLLAGVGGGVLLLIAGVFVWFKYSKMSQATFTLNDTDTKQMSSNPYQDSPDQEIFVDGNARSFRNSLRDEL